MPGEVTVSERESTRARVVLFCGGRGASLLSKELLRDHRVRLTLAINGYDDGASTGEVRRFLGDSLGPSDFRKNASRLARGLRTCPPSRVDALDSRLPVGLSREDALAEVQKRVAVMPDAEAAARTFADALRASGRRFDFNDCSVGNLVFAGVFLQCDRDFNRAVDAYCGLLGLPAGLIENVTDGTNACLVALDEHGRVLATEAEIVTTGRPLVIKDFYLLDRPLSEHDRQWLAHAHGHEAVQFFEERQAAVRLNPRLADRLADADLIVYAPGTQYSSLLPSYVTPGLGSAIAGNLHAVKVLVTNLQPDAEIAGRSAVDIVDRALYYLQEKGRLGWPTPCLITHYLMNDPAGTEGSIPYVPLGQVDLLEDPRLIRIANYEAGVTGRHDAGKVLAPFIRSLLERPVRQRVAILLYDPGSPTRLAQSILEMVRGGLASVPVDVTIFHEGDPLDPAFVARVPTPVRSVPALGSLRVEARFRQILAAEGFDYLVLLESSGMYRGEDVPGLVGYLASGRLDAVWGSRRLSPRDIEASYRIRFRNDPLRRLVSSFGSHVLSLACLGLYGRYLSDTLSGVRAVRIGDAMSVGAPLTSHLVNHHLLAGLLGRKADLVEVPVQFLPLSPTRVQRTTVFAGMGALGILVRARLHTVRTARVPPAVELAEARHGDLGSR
jgi:2-phospho-L-lactate transferase/gluconeogenesis factor (CofD/UPF0052 family)